MASVTVKNVSTAPIYIRDLSDTLEVNESVTFTRSLGELTSMNALNAFITDGSLQMVSLVATAQESFWSTAGQPLSTTEALVLYVATTGDDLNSGLTAALPLRNISTALNKVPLLVRAGKPVTVNVAAGTYSEKVMCPALILDDNVTVQGAAMVATSPAQGIASGTFDAVFGTQMFPHRALITGAGWAASGLIGGFYVEILDGTIAGSLFPVVNNTATTIDFGFVTNSGANNLQGRQFRLVKPSTILTQSVVTENNINISARVAGGATSTNGGTNYLAFSKMEIRKPTSSAVAVRVANGAYVRFINCTFVDAAGGGGTLMQVTGGAAVRMDDTLTYRGAANNTNFVSVSALSSFTANRFGSYGGNIAISIAQSFVTLSSGFISNADEGGILLQSGVSASIATIATDACDIGVGVVNGAVVTLSACVIKNATSYGVSVGMNVKTLASASFTSGFVTLFNTTVDNCVRGVAVACSSTVAMTGTTTSIVNCTSFGVDAAISLKSGHNDINVNSTLVMSGNGADFTLDGTTGISLTALRALSPKRSVEATTLNRLVEV